jgi:hypothetical protein
VSVEFGAAFLGLPAVLLAAAWVGNSVVIVVMEPWRRVAIVGKLGRWGGQPGPLHRRPREPRKVRGCSAPTSPAALRARLVRSFRHHNCQRRELVKGLLVNP